MMLDLAADFGLRNNLELWCDPDPIKTKSKGIFMIGKKTALQKPANLHQQEPRGARQLLLCRPHRGAGRREALRGQSLRRHAVEAGQPRGPSGHEMLEYHSEGRVGARPGHTHSQSAVASQPALQSTGRSVEPLGEVFPFLLLQQTAVQSSILFLSHTVDMILQTCSVVKKSAATI